MTLAMMLHAWLTAIRAQSKKTDADGPTMSEELADLSVAEIQRLLVIVFGMMVRGEEQIHPIACNIELCAVAYG